MDEALVMVAVDAGGRPYLSYDIDIPSPMLGGISSDLVEEFFRAISWNAMMNIHMKMFYGSNTTISPKPRSRRSAGL